MIARISSHFPCSETELWQRIIEPHSLQFVAFPLLPFTAIESGRGQPVRSAEGRWHASETPGKVVVLPELGQACARETTMTATR